MLSLPNALPPQLLRPACSHPGTHHERSKPSGAAAGSRAHSLPLELGPQRQERPRSPSSMDDVDGSVAVGIPVRGGAAARTNERPKSGTALKAMLVVLVIMCIVLSAILAHVMYDRPHHPARRLRSRRPPGGCRHRPDIRE